MSNESFLVISHMLKRLPYRCCHAMFRRAENECHRSGMVLAGKRYGSVFVVERRGVIEQQRSPSSSSPVLSFLFLCSKMPCSVEA